MEESSGEIIPSCSKTVIVVRPSPTLNIQLEAHILVCSLSILEGQLWYTMRTATLLVAQNCVLVDLHVPRSSIVKPKMLTTSASRFLGCH